MAQQADPDKTDIIIPIKVDQVYEIQTRERNHVFRKYHYPGHVKHIWIYASPLDRKTSLPVQEIRYVAQISPMKRPGEVAEDGGLGNKEFNAGETQDRFGFEIEHLWELTKAWSLDALTENGILSCAPGKYNFVSEERKQRLMAQGLTALW